MRNADKGIATYPPRFTSPSDPLITAIEMLKSSNHSKPSTQAIPHLYQNAPLPEPDPVLNHGQVPESHTKFLQVLHFP